MPLRIKVTMLYQWWGDLCTLQAKKSFIQEPILVVVECWVAHGCADDSAFIVREDVMVEGILAILLLEDAFVGNGFGGEETEGAILQHGA